MDRNTRAACELKMVWKVPEVANREGSIAE